MYWKMYSLYMIHEIRIFCWNMICGNFSENHKSLNGILEGNSPSLKKIFDCPFSLQNSGAQYVGNKMPRWSQDFSVCLGNASEETLEKKETAKDSAETCLYYVNNGFGIRQHFTKGYDFVFFNSWGYLFYLNYITYF